MKNSSVNIKFWKPNELHEISKVCISNATFLRIKLYLDIPGRESNSYFFSSFPVPGLLDKLYYLVLTIALEVGIIILIL